MSHADALEATLDRLIDEASTLEDAARAVVQQAATRLETWAAITELARVLDRLDAERAAGE